MHESFDKVSKNLATDTDLKIMLLNHQNNYVGHLSGLLELKLVATFSIINN